jgi:endonuclease YncB( thermonuclease family)
MRKSAQSFAWPIKLSAFLAVALVLMTPVATAAPIVPAGQTFLCTPTHVWDGDGPIWCREGPRVRLAGVAAREMDGTCNRNQPCPQASAEAARDALVLLIGTPTGIGRHDHILVDGPTMQCKSDGSAGRNRTAAWCVSPKSGDVNCNIISGGWALRWDRYWRGHRC